LPKELNSHWLVKTRYGGVVVMSDDGW
jgi:hypothetical protein